MNRRHNMALDQPRKTNKFILVAAAAAALFSVGLLLQQSDLASLPSVEAGEGVTGKAPEITLETLDGKKYKLSEDPNKVVVIDFWATWCPPCVKGLPKLQETADWVKKENLKVSIYPINSQETPSEVLKFWTDKKFTMPVLLDSDGVAGTAYKVRGIPTTVVIVNGNITKTFVGLSPNMETELRNAINDGLKKAQAEQKPKEEAPKDSK